MWDWLRLIPCSNACASSESLAATSRMRRRSQCVDGREAGVFECARTGARRRLDPWSPYGRRAHDVLVLPSSRHGENKVAHASRSEGRVRRVREASHARCEGAICGEVHAKRVERRRQQDQKKKGRRRHPRVSARHLRAANFDARQDNPYALAMDKTYTVEDVDRMLNGPFIIKFTAGWCGPCRRIEPLLEDLATTYAGCSVVPVNVDVNADVAMHFDARSIPLMLFGNRSRVRLVGTDEAAIRAAAKVAFGSPVVVPTLPDAKVLL